MLTHTQARRGFTLAEMMIALVIVAVMLAIGVPSFSTWLQNLQIRNAAESIKNGLVFAQTEAMRRNTPIRFQLVSSIDATCALSTTKPGWVVNVGDSATNDPSGACGPASETVAPFIIKSVPAADGMRNAVIDSTESTIVFNSFGKAISLTGTLTIGISNTNGGACAPDGPMNCMRVIVSPVGQIRMCNPNPNLNGKPMGC